ncbi:TPA: LexA family protein [Providencia alcalifaciens]
MNFDESFPKRVSMARNSLKLTQSELAAKVGVVPRQIAAYEGGEARPRSKALVNLAAALGTTTEWLCTGSGVSPDLKNVRNTVTTIEIPVYDSSANVMDETQLWTDHVYEEDYIQAPHGVSENAFAIQIKGDSMDSPYGLSIPSGSLVIIEPITKPESGDFVFIQHGSIASLKKLTRSNDSWILESLNPMYAPYHIDYELADFLGVAVQVIIDLKSKGIANSYPNRPIFYGADEDIDDTTGLPTIESRLSRIEFMLEELLSKK